MRTIDIYLAHRDSTKFITKQVTLIRKYFNCNIGSKINIYGYVDGKDDVVKNTMRNLWIENNVTPIEIPNIIDNIDRSNIWVGTSFGLAFTYVYKNYILNNNNIAVCLENDVFPFRYINIEDYVKDYEICGEVRFNAAQLPDRNVMFWLGIIIFNNEKMSDRELFTAYAGEIVNKQSGRRHGIDCGGHSYYWITNTHRKIRQMVTNGNENYDGFTSLECTPHNITNDIHLLPEIFREGYSNFRVVIYDNCLMHLEGGRDDNYTKEEWWNNCYNKLIKNE